MLHPTVGNLSFFSTVDDGKSEQSSCVAPFFSKSRNGKRNVRPIGGPNIGPLPEPRTSWPAKEI
jgi:hypothetical protein